MLSLNDNAQTRKKGHIFQAVESKNNTVPLMRPIKKWKKYSSIPLCNILYQFLNAILFYINDFYFMEVALQIIWLWCSWGSRVLAEPCSRREAHKTRSLWWLTNRPIKSSTQRTAFSASRSETPIWCKVKQEYWPPWNIFVSYHSTSSSCEIQTLKAFITHKASTSQA